MFIAQPRVEFLQRDNHHQLRFSSAKEIIFRWFRQEHDLHRLPAWTNTFIRLLNASRSSSTYWYHACPGMYNCTVLRVPGMHSNSLIMSWFPITAGWTDTIIVKDWPTAIPATGFKSDTSRLRWEHVYTCYNGYTNCLCSVNATSW